MKKRRFMLVLLLETLIVVAVLFYFLVDSSTVYRFFMGNIKFYKQSKQCDLHVSSCAVDIPDLGELRLEIEPKTIPLMKKLLFSLTTKKDINQDNLSMHLYASNMNMGYHTFTLKKISNNNYLASGILPACTTGKMVWNVEIVNKNRGALFTFKTE